MKYRTAIKRALFLNPSPQGTMSMRGRLLRAALVPAFMAVAAMPMQASAQDAPVHFDLPAQDMATTLNQFSVMTDRQIVFAPDLVRDLKAPALAGDYTPQQAIDLLLAGTSLRYRLVAPGRYAVVAEGDTDDTPFVTGAGDVTTPLAPSEAPQTSTSADVSQSVESVTAADADTAPETTVTTGKSGGITEIIVTAQKKSENIQDVPIAITALSMEDLTNRQIAGGPDLFTQVPNMSFTKTNFTGYSIQIRGIGTQAISATTDPAVAVALNNTPFIHNRFFEQEFYDLERLEVLRGPQGTLYGRNATAGVVNLISARPKFYSEARSSIDIGNYNSQRVEQMINIPLVEDMAALRFAGEWTKRDGYSENEITGSPIDGRDLWSTRTSLRVKPNDDLDINLMWEHFQENDDRLRSGKQLCDKDLLTNVAGFAVTPDMVLPEAGQQSIFSGAQASFSQGCKRNSLYSKNSYQTPEGLMLPYYAPLGAIGLPVALTDPYATATQPHDLRKIQSTIDPDYTAGSDITELQINWDLSDHLTLTSETGYDNDSVNSLEDFNRFNTAPGAWATTPDHGSNGPLYVSNGVLSPDGVFCDPQLGCSDRLVAVDIAASKSRQFSQELRLSSNFDGPFNFSVGGNYLHFDTLDKYQVFFNSISLIAAGNPYRFNPVPLPAGPYVPGQTDNSGCLLNGYAPGNPNAVYAVQGCTYMDPNSIDKVNDQGHNYFLSNNPYQLRSYALFGETYWNITDNLKLTTGARWSVDQKTAPRVPTWILDVASYGYPVAGVERQEWRKPTGRVALDWKPDLSFTDQTLVYGSISRGYKAGGANPPGFVRSYYGDRSAAEASAQVSATRPTTFKAEYVNAFELGTKNTMFDGRLTANLAAFYYDYKDYQLSEIVDRSAFNHNYDAKIWGLELETDWFAMENLRLGFKGGYENARFAKGESAVDLMDRTAGDPDWTLHRPFPTFASSCILPTRLFQGVDPGTGDPELVNVGAVGGGAAGGCEMAYFGGLDPVTGAPYDAAAYEAGTTPATDGGATLQLHPGYTGFDPTDPAIVAYTNNGEGISKNIGGNNLPNAPHYTATLTADYTVPLADAWTATLHIDGHWQSQAWWRAFDDNDYGRLKAYYTMNIAAIFVNDAAGWNVMAYIKNVTDKTAITGAFLNSDDTGLTTNVFLTEPRLYGLRVTKNWEGNGLLHGFGAWHDSSKPDALTLEVGGQIQHVDASNAAIEPSFADQFTGPLDVFGKPQDQDLGWGEGREFKLTWRPNSGPWALSGGYRSGESHNDAHKYGEQYTEPVCALAGGIFDRFCGQDPATLAPLYAGLVNFSIANNAAASVMEHEEHHFTDLLVSRDLMFGSLNRSAIGLGIRRARFESDTEISMNGIPDWNIPENTKPFKGGAGNFATRTLYNADYSEQRTFKGTGPVLSWDASSHLFGNEHNGHLDVDWSLSGGVLFGDQHVTTAGTEMMRFNEYVGLDLIAGSIVPPSPTTTTQTSIDPTRRHKSVDVPLLGGSLGLTYRVAGFSLGADYRWERYFNVIDGGFDEHKSYDRTIQGPHFKATIGFGG